MSPLLKPYAVFVGFEIYSQHKKRNAADAAYAKAKRLFPDKRVCLKDSICFDKNMQVLRATESYVNVIDRNWFTERTSS